MPRVSVIMASYGHEEFVGRAVQSVLDQTFRDLELVITDDASPDATAEVIERFEDPRIDLERFDRNRQASARNRSLARASGEYVAIQNSDDEFDPRKLERQVEWLDDHPETGAVFTLVRMIDERGDDYPDRSHPYCLAFSSRNRSRFEWLRRFFDRGNCLCITSAMVRRDLIEEVGRFDPLLAQLADLDLWIRVCLRTEIHILPEELTSMRLLAGEANASGRRAETVRRSADEQYRLLSHYRTPLAVSQLPRIFPELADDDPERPESVLLCRLARYSMSRETPWHRLFGLDLLRSVLDDPRARSEVAAWESGVPIAELVEAAGEIGVLAPEAEDRIELYGSIGGRFDPRGKSVGRLLAGSRGRVRLVCPAGTEDGHRVRLDPGDRPGVVTIHSLVVRDPKSREVLAQLEARELARQTTIAGTAVSLASRHSFRFLSTGTDPQLLLSLPAAAPGGQLEIEVELEIDPDLGELQGRLAPLYTMRQAIRLRASLVKRWLKRRIAVI